MGTRRVKLPCLNTRAVQANFFRSQNMIEWIEVGLHVTVAIIAVLKALEVLH